MAEIRKRKHTFLAARPFTRWVVPAIPNPTCNSVRHPHTQPSEGACHYGCILKGHNDYDWNSPTCRCCDDPDSDRCN